MKNIKSITDVITNSSTEVFTCRTTKSLREVSEFLRRATSGYDQPEIMSKDKGCLKRLIDFGYLVDPDDPESLREWILNAIFLTDSWDEDYNFHEIPHAKELKLAFGRHIWKNLDYLQEYVKNKYPSDSFVMRYGGFLGEDSYKPYLVDEGTFLDAYMDDRFYDVKHGSYYPEGFIENFLESYEGQRPATLIIKDEDNANYYVGQIGFMGLDDNSIPYESFEEINDYLNATNWHLG